MHLRTVGCYLMLFFLCGLVNSLPAAAPDLLPLTGGDQETPSNPLADEAVIQYFPAETPETGLSVLFAADPADKVKFCWEGWSDTNFKGSWVGMCCHSKCCFYHSELANNVYSARATYIPEGAHAIILWSTDSCSGETRWLDFDGWYNLENAPPYYSFSL